MCCARDNSKGSFPCDGCVPDPVANARFVRDVYERELAERGVSAEGVRFTVPLLFDTATRRIVSNESEDIVRMFNAEFNAFAKHPEVDVYPEPLRECIDATNAWTYRDINNGACCRPAPAQVHRAETARAQACTAAASRRASRRTRRRSTRCTRRWSAWRVC